MKKKDKNKSRAVLYESRPIKDILIAAAKHGLSDEQLAEIVQVTRTTLSNWKNYEPAWFDTLKDAKLQADSRVEKSLFQRALGYTTKETKVFYDAKRGECVEHIIEKNYPPDPTSIIFWLKNRNPEKWRDKQEVDHNVTTGSSLVVNKSPKTFEQFCEASGYPAPFEKQKEMMIFGMKEGEPGLLLGARGYGKTDYVTILGTAYFIYLDWFTWENYRDKHPALTETNLIISKSKTRNTAMIEEIANALKGNGVPLEKENSSCIRVEGLVGKDHSAEVLTIKSSFRGRHPRRIKMDDPVTEEDTSDAMRILVKKKYDEAYKLCKNICVIGQPAHAFDLYSDLRPMLKKMEVPHGTIPELDADLEAMKLAGVDEKSIQMSYHLTVPPESDNALASIQFLDRYPQKDSVAFIDPSFEGGDYTALTVITSHFEGVAVQGYCFKKAWNHCLDEMVLAMNKHGVKKICIETNSLGDQPVLLLRQTVPQGVGVVGKKSTGHKHSRIMAAGVFAKSIFISKTSDKIYIDQVIKYEYGAKHDDAPDSLASALEWIGLIRGKK